MSLLHFIDVERGGEGFVCLFKITEEVVGSG